MYSPTGDHLTGAGASSVNCLWSYFQTSGIPMAAPSIPTLPHPGDILAPIHSRSAYISTCSLVVVILGKIIKPSAFYFKPSQLYTLRSVPEESTANGTCLRAGLGSTVWLSHLGQRLWRWRLVKRADVGSWEQVEVGLYLSSLSGSLVKAYTQGCHSPPSPTHSWALEGPQARSLHGSES